MPHTRLKYKLPRGAFEFSTNHPDEEFRMLAAFSVDDELFVAFETPTENHQAVLRYFDEAPVSYDVLHIDEQSVLIQYNAPFVPPPARAVLASGNLVQFPLVLRDGWITFDLTTSHERLHGTEPHEDAPEFEVAVPVRTEAGHSGFENATQCVLEGKNLPPRPRRVFRCFTRSLGRPTTPLLPWAARSPPRTSLDRSVSTRFGVRSRRCRLTASYRI